MKTQTKYKLKIKYKYPDHNNKIIKLLKAQFKITDDELWQIWNLGGLELSKSAARTFTVGGNNKNYRRCSDSNLRDFIDGFIRFKNGLRYEEI